MPGMARRAGGALGLGFALGPALGIGCLLGLAGAAGAEPYAVGESIPALSLADQHGEPGRVGPETRVVLFSRDMEGGGILKEALAEGGAEFLERHGAAYVADVSGMPAMVRWMMAKPAMRRRAYRMLLDETGEETARFPSESGRATVLKLEGLVLTEVRFAESVAELREAVAPAPPPGAAP